MPHPLQWPLKNSLVERLNGDMNASSKGEKNRAAILEAANALFYKQGFGATSFADIAKASDIPKGNFYFYFRSKEELLQAVLHDRLERIISMLQGWEVEFLEPRDRLHRYADIPLNDWSEITEYGCPMGTMSAELCKTTDKGGNVVNEAFAVLVVWSGQQIKKLGYDAETSGRMARHLLMRMQGAANMAHTFHDKSWIEEENQAIHEWIKGL